MFWFEYAGGKRLTLYIQGLKVQKKKKRYFQMRQTLIFMRGYMWIVRVGLYMLYSTPDYIYFF